MARPITDELLQEFEQRLRDLGAPVVRYWRPGATDAVLASVEHEIGFRLPAEMATWWRWHDGLEPAAGAERADWIGPGFEPMSIAQALTQFRLARDIAARVGTSIRPADWWWDPGWLPLVHLPAGWIVGECTEHPRKTTPLRVIEPATFDTGAFRHPVGESLGDLVAAWTKAIDRGAWFLGDEGWEWRGDDEDPRHRAGLI